MDVLAELRQRVAELEKMGEDLRGSHCALLERRRHEEGLALCSRDLLEGGADALTRAIGRLRDAPCSFCTNDRIFGEGLGESCVWEFRNESNGRWYRCMDKAIAWPDGRMVRHEMAVDITDLKQAEETLEHRVAFERLVGEVASDLAGAVGDEIDPVLDRVLGALGVYTEADRAYVFQFCEGGTRMDNTHEWCAEGIEPQMEGLKGIALDVSLPWFAQRIRGREVFHVPDVALLPDEARLEREHFEAQAIQSLVVVPMESAGNLVGFLGFDAVRELRVWTGDDQSLLRFAAETIAHVIERKRATAMLEASEE